MPRLRLDRRCMRARCRYVIVTCESLDRDQGVGHASALRKVRFDDGLRDRVFSWPASHDCRTKFCESMKLMNLDMKNLAPVLSFVLVSLVLGSCVSARTRPVEPSQRATSEQRQFRSQSSYSDRDCAIFATVSMRTVRSCVVWSAAGSPRRPPRRPGIAE